jgi:TolA-binding protein
MAPSRAGQERGMKSSILFVCVLLAAPALAPGASREIQDLQRDVALLQQQIKDLQRSQDEKLATVIELARQAIDAANKANTGVAVVTNNIEKTLAPIQSSITAPLAGLNTRVNETSNDVRTLQQNVGDLAATLNRMQQQMEDVKRLVQTLQAPAPAPAQPAAGAPGAPGVAPSGDKPQMSASDLYTSARSDMLANRTDLALQGFADFLRWYPAEKLAPNAQFYTGVIHYQAKNYDQAVKDFDLVLEHYTENPKTEEARLYKGRALVQIPGHKTEGVNEFRQLIKDYPKGDPARAACEELKGLGMNCPAGPTGANRTTANKRSSKR